MEKVTNPNELRKLVMDLQEQAQEEKGARFEKELDSELFPIEMVTPEWIECAMNARRKSSPLSHRISLKDFAKTVNFGCQIIPDKLSIFQFGILYNSLENVTQEQLGLNDADYEILLLSGLPALNWYQKRVKAIREKLEADVDKEFEMKRAALVGSAAKNGGLKRVIGEA